MKKLLSAATITFLLASATAYAFKVGGMTWVTTDGTSGQAITTNGSGTLGWTSFIGSTFLSATAPLVYSSSTGIISMPAATNSVNGYLTSADRTNFNDRITGLTSDVSATGPSGGSGPAVVNATVNTVGGSTAANVHAAELLANAATSANTASTIVKRGASGEFTAGTITATLTGVASGNLAYTANNHGVLFSGSGNTVSVLAPDASTTKVLVSGGTGADPSWLTSTGTGNNVLSASPTLTGTIGAANETLSGTLGVTGVATFTAQPIMSSLTASQAVFTDGSKGLVSNAITGTGSVVMSASPTMTGTAAHANGTFSGTLGVTGVATFTAQPIVSSLTASQAIFSDGSKGLVSNAITGSGNVVMSASPTLTGTIGAAAGTFSSTLGVTGVATFTAQPIVSSLTASLPVFSDGSKGLVSNTMTGTGSVVMSASPTLTGTALATNIRTSGTLEVGGTNGGSATPFYETGSGSIYGTINTTHTDGGYFKFQNSGTDSYYLGSYKNLFGSGSSTAMAISSAVAGDALTLGAASTPKVTIMSKGYVGVGSATNLATLNVTPIANFTATGTTTVNASTTVTGASTLFTKEVGVGDRVSVSSASSTFAYVTAIASDTSLTISPALGDGTSQTITVAKALARLDTTAGIGAASTSVSDQGFLMVGYPSARDVNASVNATGDIQVRSANGSIQAYRYANSASGPSINMFKSRSATVGTATVVTTGDNLGTVNFRGIGTDGAAYSIGAQILGDSEGTIGSSIVPGKLSLLTANSSGTLVAGLTINSAQLVTMAGAVTMSNAAVKLTGVTTGTNADTLCLAADGTVLIQAAACTISSKRFKEEIVPLKEGSGLEELMKLQPVSFKMKPNAKPNADVNFGKTQVGLIAEDIAAIDPRLAIYEQDGKTPKSYRQEALIGILVKAVQEQQKEIEKLKKFIGDK